MKIKPSMLSSFSLFLNFVMNSPMAKNALSGSTDVGLIVDYILKLNACPCLLNNIKNSIKFSLNLLCCNNKLQVEMN